MQKFLFALPAVLLALFLFGCGNGPDDELIGKVPASADALAFFDGNSAMRTKLCANHRKDIQAALKKAFLPEEVFQCRMLFFGSAKEDWGGVLAQSDKGQVRKLYDRLMAECRKIPNLQETAEGEMRKVTGTLENVKVLGVLYHDDLLLIAVNRTDPAFFAAKSVHPLFKEIKMRGTICSAAVKPELTRQVMFKRMVDEILKRTPALAKLRLVTVNMPFSADKPRMDVRMVFADAAAAGEVLAVVNTGLGEMAKAPDREAAAAVRKIDRKAEKSTLRISLPIGELVEQALRQAGKKAQRARSIDNLKLIGLYCHLFSFDHNDKFPDRLTTGFDAYFGKNADKAATVFVSPLDSRRKASADKIIRPSNISYAYVGKGLSLSSLRRPSRLPLAFEKPDVVAAADGFCGVLFADGHVARVRVEGRTCRVIVEELTKDLAGGQDAQAVALILANAAAEDRAE